MVIEVEKSSSPKHFPILAVCDFEQNVIQFETFCWCIKQPWFLRNANDIIIQSSNSIVMRALFSAKKIIKLMLNSFANCNCKQMIDHHLVMISNLKRVVGATGTPSNITSWQTVRLAMLNSISG